MAISTHSSPAVSEADHQHPIPGAQGGHGEEEEEGARAGVAIRTNTTLVGGTNAPENGKFSKRLTVR